jgi:two-component system response regulator FixJ
MERPHRIAIVDPDIRLWGSLERALADLPVELETYPCAEGFLAAPGSDMLDCVVAELDLPGASGLALIRQLRRLEIHVPTIILSSRSELTGAVGAMRAGACDYLPKPFVHNRIRDWVSRIISLKPA